MEGENQIWDLKCPLIPSGLEPVTANFTSLEVTSVNVPPDSAIIEAVQASSSTDKIDLSFTFGNVSHLDHVEMYFTEPFLENGATRSFNVIVNNDFVNSTSPEYQKCLSIWANALSLDALNVQLAPTDDSTLPPIISAIEVYTISEPLVTATTSQNDLDGLGEFVDNFEQLKGWSGEPCLPNDTIWQWLNCSGDQPPRVTSIYLSGYGLQGSLPDFSQMDALEIIDLHNNRLNGEIPEFLGKLPNLRRLDLRDNDFSGNVPETITDNRQIKYMIDGNENLNHRKNKKAEKIVAYVLASVIGVFIGFYCVGKYYEQRQTPQTQGQIAQVRVENTPEPWPTSRERLEVTVRETVEVNHVNMRRY
ncbi:probable LRR receptor-like serine/threonine-protein kinase At1g05700 [Durio zibethinus]|uniref:Probable LRR receptor-like serine/threonine-protein kinase At1g05700 n=1 Tax=Durio zibethinus TaxID=66656 RepID=A0A6P5XJV3_DURZI|nr:probable LRR receptor-like serine/threonine-protein kinase At1g05700 [Durio zibethinus]